MEQWQVDGRAVTAVDVTATIYHTIDHAVAHNEGDTYTVDDYNLAMTLYGIGFVDITGMVTSVTVPNVVGQTQAAAESAIVAAGLTVGAVTSAPDAVVPAGSVISQTPTAGAAASSGTAVDLVVSTGP